MVRSAGESLVATGAIGLASAAAHGRVVPAGTVRAEWQRHWALVLAALIGSSFSAVSVQSMTFFIDPLHAEFGWSRTQTTIGLTLFAFIVTPLAPFAGALIDRYGPRRMAIGGLALGIATLASFGLTTGSIPLWILQWTIYAFAALALKMTVWTAAVSAAFDEGRGMALAVTLCGTALAQTLTPLLTYWLIEHGGWRVAYLALAGGWGGLALLLVAFCFHSGTAGGPARPVTGTSATGLTVRQALRSPVLYRLALALAISSILSVAIITHKVSILNEMGMSRLVAAQIAATAGGAAIAGKLGAGWLYDRTASPMLGAAAFGLPTIGFILLLEPIRTPLLVVVAMILFGLGTGAGLQAAVYLISRYGGLRHFGKIFGTIGSVTIVGIGVGPLLGSVIVDHFGSYAPLILLGVPLSALSAVLMIGLGPYPDWTATEAGQPNR